MLKRGSAILSTWCVINFILALIILSYVIVFKRNSPILQVASFSEIEIASLGAKTMAALNTLTILYNSCSMVLSVLVWLVIQKNLNVGQKWAFWALLFVIGFVEVMAFFASSYIGHGRWQVNVLQSILYIVGISLCAYPILQPKSRLHDKKQNEESSTHMKAIICTKYGSPDVLQLQEVAKPVPQDGEILIRIHAASINARDWRFMRAKPFFIRLMPGGLLQPKNRILGADVAGWVEAIGSNVKQFKPGDEVFGYLPSTTGRGTFAEYVCASENAVALKPINLSYKQSAAVPVAAMTALQALRTNGNIQPGQKVLINGASGGVGTFAVQIAKAFGAEVTAVCSTRNLDMVRSIGANHVIDYTREDFPRNGLQYDLILAVNGYRPISEYLRTLCPEGSYVVAGGSMFQLIQAGSTKKRFSKTGTQKISIVSLVPSQKDLIFVKELLETGKITPVIDACYPLSRTPEAFWYFEKEHPRGKIVIGVT